MYDGIAVAIRVTPSFGHPARLVLTAESGNTGVGQEFPAPVLFMSFYTVSQLGWTFRISSGVSEGIYKSVVKSDWEFLNVGVGDSTLYKN